MGWTYWNQLDRIEAKLDQVLRLERKIMASEQELDDQITALAAAQEEEGTQIDLIIQKVSEAGVDLTDEVAALSAARDKAVASTEAIKTALGGSTPEPTP